VQSPAEGDVTAATRQELRAAGVERGAVGQLVLALARRIDGGASENGSALASLAKEFRASLGVVMTGAEPADDPIDELRRQRELKRRGPARGGA